MTWTDLDVMARLVEAAEVISAVSGRASPGSFGNNHPDIWLERDKGDYPREMRLRFNPSSAQISRAEETQGWWFMLPSEDARRELQHRAATIAFGWSWARHCKKMGWKRTTINYRINKSLQALVIVMDQREILRRSASDRHLRQVEGIFASKSDIDQKCATSWLADGARPSAENFGTEEDPMKWAREQAERRKRKLLGAEIEEELERAPARTR